MKRHVTSLPLLLAVLLGGAFGQADAQPGNREIPPPQRDVLNAPGSGGITGRIGAGVYSGAVLDTVYFGGTVWAADSSRWEALPDSVWTFDTGVGTHFNHAASGVNPFKDPSLQAYMEGWVGIDRTYIPITYFRRLNSTQFPSGQNQCVLSGSWSFWCGVLASEANSLCYADGQGYGNDWHVCIEHSFTYNGSGNVTLQYDYRNDTELDSDFTSVYVDTTAAGANVLVTAYTDLLTGTAIHTLVPGAQLPNHAGSIKIRFCVDSDGAYSDEDGLYPTRCGAFTLDNLSVSGGGITHSTGFETSADGWILTPLEPGPGGDWSRLAAVSDLPPPLTDCVCNFRDTVMVFEDLSRGGGHNIFQNNFAASPWIDLNQYGLVGMPNKFIQCDLYADMPLLNYIYAQFFVQWYPWACPATNKLMRSPWVIDGVTHYYGGVPTCTSQGGAPFRSDFSALMDAGASQVRIGIGIFSACLFYPNCTGLTNSSPWFDNVRFGVGGDMTAGSPAAPMIAARQIDLPQDTFPADGTLHLGSTGRFDSGTLKGASEAAPGTALGDTLVVEGGSGGAEVWVQFAVRPGVGTDPGGLAAFYGRVAFVENRRGLSWYAARMDTAEQGGVPSPGYWMTTFHEASPGFQGTDRTLDPNDLDPHGGMTHLANDIFPDNLFSPGTRVNLFYKSKFTAGSIWSLLPDTTGGNYLEMEVLPSSMDSVGTFNCVLYVDHADNLGSQEYVKAGLGTALSGTSRNYEKTPWDRYDVRASSGGQITFGRPSGSPYGATLTQLSGYRGIVWDTGDLDARTLVDEDAAVLVPWLETTRPGGNRLYLSGDGLAQSVTQAAGTDPQAADLLENLAGASLTCGTYRDSGCPPSSPTDTKACVDIDPVVGAVVSLRPLGGTPRGQGNGCPFYRSFDVLGLNVSPAYGAPVGEERYNTSTKSANFASVSNAENGAVIYQTVVDGVSIKNRRALNDCKNLSFAPTAAEERLLEVMNWFGLAGPGGSCSDPAQTGIGDGTPGERFSTALAPFAPNPLPRGARGEIRFSLRAAGPVRLDILDLQGRVVKRVFDGQGTAGWNTVTWDGTDDRGIPVGSGVYFYSLRASGNTLAKKMVVVRG